MKRLAIVIAMITGYLFVIAPGNSKTVTAEEPAQAFLDALRDNGYHDIAIEYLESLKDSDLIPDDFKKVLPFELAQTMIGSTVSMRDLEKRDARLDEAQKLLTEYANGDQTTEVNARTMQYQGDLNYRRSIIYVTQSESDRLTAGEKNELFEKARTNLSAALESYEKAKSEIRKLIDPGSADVIRIDPEDPSTKRELEQFQTKYVFVWLSLAKVSEQLADTYEAGSDDQKKLLTKARDEFQQVFDRYPRYIPGLEACVSSARCSHKLDQHKEALVLLSEIFSLGDNSVFKSIKMRAYALAADCWARIDPYPYNEVVIRLQPAVALLNKMEVKEEDWLRVQMELAIAQRAKAAEIKAKGGPTSNRESKELERDAAKVMRNVTRVPGPLRDKAKELLSQWDVNITDVAETSETPPASFEDARSKGKEIVTDIEVVVGEAAQLRRDTAAEPDPARKSELQRDYDEITARIDEQCKSALALFDSALSMANSETIRADINNVRYLQCYCYFVNQQYVEAAVIGEFLLEKYPNVDGTKQAMTLLIQSYSILMDRADEGDKSYERIRLETTASEVVERWPGSNEAGAAASAMTRLGLNENDFEMAQKYFAQIPADAPYRDQVALRFGVRMWYDYKTKSRLPDADEETLKPQLVEATEYMASGVNAMTIDELNYDGALAALYLVDANLRLGDVPNAIERLESATIAPLDLVKQKHPAIVEATTADLYRQQTYQSAIKAYLAAMEGSSEQQKWVTRAGGIIDAMREEMKTNDDPKARARVTAIYQLIAKELKENFESIKDIEKKKKFAQSLSDFLGSIENESNDARVVLWAGSTLLTVAESLTESGLEAQAGPMFTQAVTALSKAETIGLKGESDEDAMLLELKRQRGLAHRGSGKYDEAINQFIEVLTESPNSLAVQLDAADTLQRWGKATKNAKRYIEAVKGSNSVMDPKTKRSRNLIWGWEKTALATRSNEKLRDVFYETLLHVAECRLEYGLLTDNAGAIKAAGNEIAKERKRDPTFNGSEEWKSKFAELEKRVNAAK